MVLIAHSDIGLHPESFQFHLGGLGVKFFFVLSGFLIKWLLLREHSESGRVNLKAFYLRRAFRILPVYYAYLLSCYALQGFYAGGLSPNQWMANMFFLTNYTEAKWLTGHLWTLAVEEQFYILSPLAFSFCRMREKLLVGLLVAAIAACPVIRGCAYLLGQDSFFIFHRFSFLMQADVLAIGCLAAVVFWHRPHLWNRVGDHYKICFVIGLALVSVFWALPEIQGLNLVKVPLGSTIYSTGFILMLLPTLVKPEQGVFRLLNTRLVVSVGILSYSIYIWHVLFVPVAWTGRGNAGTDLFFSNPMWVIPTLCTAIGSYFLLEKPLMGLRKKFLTHP